MSIVHTKSLSQLIANEAESYKAIAVSTANVSPASLEWLANNHRTSNCVFHRDTGYLMKLYDDFLLSYADDTMPPELEHLITLVLEGGFYLLEIDADAQVLDFFPRYQSE